MTVVSAILSVTFPSVSAMGLTVDPAHALGISEVLPENPTSDFSMWAQWVFTILVVVYEVVVRFFPTSRSLSIISFAIKLLDFIIPDRASRKARETLKSAGTGSTHAPTVKKNLVDYLF